MPLVADPNNIRLGIAGKVDENDHPFSWSALLNGYNADAMREFAHPMISNYLAARTPAEFGIEGVRVTHVWCDDRADAKRIAKASRIENVVDRAEQLIGKVDAVLIPTDRGEEHVSRAKLFVDAKIPVFIDKPLCDNIEDLRTFENWIATGKPILSCSAMRFAVEYDAIRKQFSEIGEKRLITIAMAKSWRRYGIHALEAIYPFLPPSGWKSAANCGTDRGEVVRYEHAGGVIAVVMVGDDWFGGFGAMNVYGTKSSLSAKFSDSFTAFKRQLSAFVDYLRSGTPPWDFAETRELMQMLIAAEISRSRGGVSVSLPLE
jgi:Oxidoreductase family, NAD-binding Rossmann fold